MTQSSADHQTLPMLGTYPTSCVAPHGAHHRTSWRETLHLWTFGLFRVPMIFSVRPRVLWINNTSCSVLVPLRRKTQNHFKTMYFGAIAVGADCTAGMMAMYWLYQKKQPVSLLFQDFHIDFLKRPSGDLIMVSEDCARMGKLIDEAIATKQRLAQPFYISGFVAKQSMTEPVVRASLTVSLKASRVGAL